MTVTHTVSGPIRQERELRLSALNRLTAAVLLASAAVLGYVQAVLVGHFRPDLTVIAALESGAAALVALPALGRPRWAPLLGTLFGTLTLVGNHGPILYDLAHPEALHAFTFMAVAVAIALVMIVAGLAATAQNYRHPGHDRPTPRMLAPALAATVALVLGAVGVAAIPRETGAGVRPEVLAQLPALASPGLHFDQAELRVKSGELVALRLENPHSIPHSFDIDALNVHVAMPTGEAALALFTAPAPGSYPFYCAVPGHAEAGMRGTLIVEP